MNFNGADGSDEGDAGGEAVSEAPVHRALPGRVGQTGFVGLSGAYACIDRSVIVERFFTDETARLPSKRRGVGGGRRGGGSAPRPPADPLGVPAGLCAGPRAPPP